MTEGRQTVNPWFWVWVALVIVFTVAEIIEGGGFIGPWAVGALAAAVLEAAGSSIDLQWVAFIGLSSIGVIGWRRLMHPVARDVDPDERTGRP